MSSDISVMGGMVMKGKICLSYCFANSVNQFKLRITFKEINALFFAAKYTLQVSFGQKIPYLLSLSATWVNQLNHTRVK